MDDLSYDQLIDNLIELRVGEMDRVWMQAAIVFVLRRKMKVKAGDIAYHMGCSSTYVGDLERTFAAFPDEYMRNKEMSFTIHKLCAKSDNPEYWLEQSEHNQWSTRQLTSAMKGNEQEDGFGKVLRLFNRVEKVLDGGGPDGEWLYKRLGEKYMNLYPS